MEEIMEKYAEEEKKLEERIRECEELRNELRSKHTADNLSNASLSDLQAKHEKARARNRKILQDLEKAKAILRTESSFSPSEQELRHAAAVYRSFLDAPDDK